MLNWEGKMPSITQPLNSSVMITPYSQRLLQYGIENSKIYLSKATNSLLNTFTRGYGSNFFPEDLEYETKIKYEMRDSCILDGLETSFSLNGNILAVTVQPGSLIVDTTLLSFPYATELDLDLTDYGNSISVGYVIVSVNFQWVDSVYDQTPKLKLSYIHPSDSYSVEPNGWILAQDKLVITLFEFQKNTQNNVIESSINNLVPAPCINTKRHYLVIKDLPYEVAPLSKPIYNLINTLHVNYTKKIVYNIPPGVNPEGLPESELELSFYLENLESIQLLELHLTMGYDPLLVSNFTIETGSAATNTFKTATFTIDSSNNALNILVSGNNMVAIDSGVVVKIKCIINNTVEKDTPITFTLPNIYGINNLGQTILLNGDPATTPQLDGPLSFTAARPAGIPGESDVDFSKLWKYGTPPSLHDNKYYFYNDIDISTLYSSDCTVSCYIDNVQISPSFIQILDKIIRIWMPDNFIYQTSIPVIKTVIIG